MQIPEDFADLLAAFAQAHVRYLIIGGYALGVHSVPRFTKDIDIRLADGAENIRRCASALAIFGAPESVVGSMQTAGPDDVVWMGQPPLRIDLLQAIPGVSFDDAWNRRVTARWYDMDVDVLGLEDLIASKGYNENKSSARAPRRPGGKALRRRNTRGISRSRNAAPGDASAYAAIDLLKLAP